MHITTLLQLAAVVSVTALLSFICLSRNKLFGPTPAVAPVIFAGKEVRIGQKSVATYTQKQVLIRQNRHAGPTQLRISTKMALSNAMREVEAANKSSAFFRYILSHEHWHRWS